MQFIKTVDSNKRDVIINIEGITHVRYYPHPSDSTEGTTLTLHFGGDADMVRVVEAEAERLWNILNGLVAADETTEER
jgi:hypothetical protein